MPIVSTRIDDRLIHGQVATSWISYVGAGQIICVSDKAAANPIQAQVLKMAAPSHKVLLFSVDKFIEIATHNPINKDTFLITDSTYAVQRMVESGIDIKRVNFGGMRPDKGRDIMVSPYMHFNQQEFDAIEKLYALGVRLDWQVAAYDAPVDLREHMKTLKESK